VKKFLRTVAAQLLAAAFVVTALSGPARADTSESDADIAREWQTAWDTYKFYDTTPPLPDSGRSRVTTSISIDINAAAKRVFAEYSDFNHHIGRNPFLTRVIVHSATASSSVSNGNTGATGPKISWVSRSAVPGTSASTVGG
jgi:hypothetical protein